MKPENKQILDMVSSITNSVLDKDKPETTDKLIDQYVDFLKVKLKLDDTDIDIMKSDILDIVNKLRIDIKNIEDR